MSVLHVELKVVCRCRHVCYPKLHCNSSSDVIPYVYKEYHIILVKYCLLRSYSYFIAYAFNYTYLKLIESYTNHEQIHTDQIQQK